MKRPALALTALGIVAAALLMAGCGGGSSSSATVKVVKVGGPSPSGGRKATAPNAPAGSKVVACKERRGETVQLRAAGVGCGAADRTMRHWTSNHACTLGQGESRNSCSVDGFRCQAVRVDAGASVSCAQRGEDIAFIIKR